MATIIFQPSGRRGEVPVGITILEASRRIGADIESLCGGKKTCGKCKVKIEEGRFEKYGVQSGQKHLSEWQEEEAKFITPEERTNGYRLSCCSIVQGDLLVFVPEESRAGKQVVSKAARDIPIVCDPAVKAYYVEMSPPRLEDPTGDFERLCDALEKRFGMKALSCDLPLLRQMPRLLRGADWKVTVSIWMEREIIRIQPGRVKGHYGVAIDLGTTTIAAYLCDLNSAKVVATSALMNPQCKYGEDVMSRISYHVANPGGLKRMSEDVVQSLNFLIEDVVKQTRADEKDVNDTEEWEESPHDPSISRDRRLRTCGLSKEDIEDMALCGNTVMHHIFLQLPPDSLGRSPFPPVLHHSLDIKARDIGLKINPSSYIHVLPIEAGFVGADNVAVLICEEPYKREPIELIIDIGTNGEIVLGNKDRLISASCATGPALEGAQLSSGMRAAPGAIEAVRISSETQEVDYKVIGRDAWKSFSRLEEMEARGICGSGILDLLAELYVSGVIDKTGRFRRKQDSERLRPRPSGEPEFVIAWASETSIKKDITITQKDVRQIQLAKAALCAGCKVLLRRWGAEAPDLIKIAGAFGAHVNPMKALIIGLFPDVAVEKIVSIGNAAGDGARIALLNRKKRLEADSCSRRVEHVELAVEPEFQNEFIHAMHIPHAVDPYPHLKGVVPDHILGQ